jgi:hypothetical protein
MQTWNANPRYHQLFDEQQVFFLDDYPTRSDKKDLMERVRLTVEHNHGLGIASLLLIDDCLAQVLSGDLPILKVFTNGRALGLTVVLLLQGNVRAGTVGTIVRVNATCIIFFNSLIRSVAKTEEWVTDEREFLLAAQPVVVGRVAGVLIAGKNPPLHHMQAPAEFRINKLGRPDLRGRLEPLPSVPPARRRAPAPVAPAPIAGGGQGALQCDVCLEDVAHEFNLVRFGCCTGKYCRECASQLQECAVCRTPVQRVTWHAAAGTAATPLQASSSDMSMSESESESESDEFVVSDHDSMPGDPLSPVTLFVPLDGSPRLFHTYDVLACAHSRSLTVTSEHLHGHTHTHTCN